MSAERKIIKVKQVRSGIGCPREMRETLKALGLGKMHRIATRVGIPADHVLVACTHTHSGPATTGLLGVDADDAYVAWLPARIADAVELAARRLQPAVLGVGATGLEGHHPALSGRHHDRVADLEAALVQALQGFHQESGTAFGTELAPCG